VVISPHLDDAVFGCAGLLLTHSNAVVITVAAGRPAHAALTDWDRACGFHTGDDVVGYRRVEDGAALRRLGAMPAWLEFLDCQYGRSPSVMEVADALEKAIAASSGEIVASPLGIGHDDHVLTASASFRVARRMPHARWIVYEDAIYRTNEMAKARAMRRARRSGFRLEAAPLDEVPMGDLKQHAIHLYRSQLKGLGDRWRDALNQESYWLLNAR
jgi:LmbE family N-acetylglucosaminyl deacetylase